jgi:alkaline phosphatase isozyme conversion protein
MLQERAMSLLNGRFGYVKLPPGRGSSMKKHPVMLVLAFLLVACNSPTPPSTATPIVPVPQISRTHIPADRSVPGEIALSHITSIANDIGLRPTGTEQESQTAQYITNTFKELGYAPETQSFTTIGKNGLVHSANVIAVKQGQSPQEIIVGAHYDSVKVGTGADDNASGVGVLLEVAERIRDIPTPYTIRFILFGAEEIGLKGSQTYAGQMKEDQIRNTVAMINLDSLIAGDIAYVYGDEGNAGVIRDWALEYAKEQNLALQTQPGMNPQYPAGTTGDFSDHAPFKALGIPYTYFESTNWTLGELDGYTQVSPEYGENGEIWHTQYDTLEYIDATFPGRIQERLNLFVTVLQGILTEYQVP